MSINVTSRIFLCSSVIVILLVSAIPVSSVGGPSGPGPMTDPNINVSRSADGNFIIERKLFYAEPIIEARPELGTYTISIAGLPKTDQDGMPALPVEGVSITIPAGLRATSVEAVPSGTKAFAIAGFITPAPVEGTACGAIDTSDPASYNFGDLYFTDALYPTATSSYTESFGLTDPSNEGQTRDNIILSSSVRSHFIDIELFPVQYNPVQGQLLFHPALTLKVTYAKDPSYISPPPRPRAPTYDNVIITPRSFVPTFQVLSDHHNATGVITTVVAVEDVYSGKYFPASALGVDNPEKIKIFIKNATDAWGLKYLTLGGDSNQIPSRHAWVAWDFASDLYYADIYMSDGSFASWDTNKDGKWGNWTDDRNKIDVHPDLYIGRLPAATLAQAAGMVAKVRNYDNTTAGDKFFKNVTFLVGIGSGDGTGYSDWLADNVYKASDGWHHNKLYNEAATAVNLSKPQNSSVGFMAFWGHGGTNVWLGGSDIWASDVNALTNFDELPIVSIMACDCGNFDGPSDGFAETFLKNPNGGALGVLAGTQTSNANDMTTWAGATNRYFHEANKDHRIHRLGAMYSAGVELFLQNKDWRSESLDYKNLLEYVMFGDPAATIGGISSTHAKISTDRAMRTGLPGQNVTFNVSIVNTGVGWADIALAFKDPVPQGWSASIPFNFTNIVPGENRTFPVNVTIPQDALAGSVLVLTLRANSTNFPEAPLSIKLTTIVDVNYTFTFDCAQNKKTIDAQGTARYQFNLVNTGNLGIEFLVEPVSPLPGWTILPVNDTPSLGPGQSHISNWNVTPGPRVENGSYPLTFKASMVHHPGNPRSITVNTTVKPFNGLKIVPEVTEADLLMGRASINLTVLNLGNHPDEFTPSIGDKTAGLIVFFIDTTSFKLPSFGNKTLNVTGSGLDGALAGDYNLTVVMALASDGSKASVNLTFHIVPRPEFSIDLSADEAKVHAKENVLFDIDIHNLGNMQDTYDIKVLNISQGWTASFETPVIGEAGLQRTVGVEIQMAVGKLLAGSYNLTIAVTSRASNVTRTAVFKVIFERVYALRIKCTPDTVYADPGQTVNITLTVYNDGNGPDTYYITVQTAAFWAVKYVSNVTLAAYSNATVVIKANPFPDAGPVSSSFTVMVNKYAPPADARDISIRAIVNTVHGLIISDKGHAIEGAPGDTYNLLISFANLGNVPDSYILTLTGPTVVTLVKVDPISVQAFGNHTSSVRVTISRTANSGNYNFTITARSSGDPSLKRSLEYSVLVTKAPSHSPLQGMIGYIAALILVFVVAVIAVLALMMRHKGRKDGEPVKKKATDEEEGPHPMGPPPPLPPVPGKP